MSDEPSGPGARLDPRGKFLAALAFSLLVSLIRTLPGTLAALAFAAVVLAGCGVRWRILLGRFLAVNVFLALLWPTLCWRLQLDGPWSWHLTPNAEGRHLALLVSLKANAVFFALLGLLGTSRATDVFHALAHLHIPPKLVTIFFLFHRYVRVIAREHQSLTRAMTVRCFKPGTNAHTYRSYAYLVGMLLARSFDRAERVYKAMLCRGFAGTFWVLDHFAWQRRDSIFCSAFGLGLLSIAFVEYGTGPWN